MSQQLVPDVEGRLLQHFFLLKYRTLRLELYFRARLPAPRAGEGQNGHDEVPVLVGVGAYDVGVLVLDRKERFVVRVGRGSGLSSSQHERGPDEVGPCLLRLVGSGWFWFCAGTQEHLPKPLRLVRTFRTRQEHIHLCRKVWGWFPLRVGIPAVPVESENREQIFAVLDECKARGFGVAVVRRQCGKSCALKLSQYVVV